MFATYFKLLRDNQNYRSLWLASTISQFGDWFNLIATTALIARLTDAGTSISFLFLARFLPLFLFSPLAGVLADRYSRRKLMMVSDLLRFVIVLGYLFVREAQHVWILYLLMVLQFTFSALFVPARTAVLANVVRNDELVTANALDSLTWSTMLFFGAAIGGLVATVFGVTTALILDSLTFLLSAWYVSRIQVQTQVRTKSDDAEPANGGWLDFLAGLRYLRLTPIILIISLVKGGGSLAWGGINVLEVSFAEDVFPLGSEGAIGTLGLIYTIGGVGTGLGPLVLRHWLGDAPQRLRQGITIGFAMIVIGIGLLAVVPNLAIFALATLIRTTGAGTIWVFSAALLHLSVPDRFKGRVFAFEFGALTLAQSISTLWAGLAIDRFGLSLYQVAAVMSGLAFVVFLLWLLAEWRQRPLPLATLLEAQHPPAQP